MKKWAMKTHKDPVTGDMLSPGEYISWLIQGIIRRWAFLGIITLATLVCWSTNNPAVLTWWNLGASYMALVIESVVGIAMFSQTKRDAAALREVRAISQHINKTTDKEEVEQKELLALLLSVEAKLNAVLAVNEERSK